VRIKIAAINSMIQETWWARCQEDILRELYNAAWFNQRL
jgi:hypothetical protein